MIHKIRHQPSDTELQLLLGKMIICSNDNIWDTSLQQMVPDYSKEGQRGLENSDFEGTAVCLWEPSGEVVHHNCCNEGLAQACGEADKGVVKEGCLDDLKLVGPLRD